MHAGKKVDPPTAYVKKEPKNSGEQAPRVKREPGSQQSSAGVLKRIEERVKRLRENGVYLDFMDLFIFAEKNNKVQPMYC